MTTPADAPTEPGGAGWFDAPIGLGARLGRYEVRSVVGSGGMGVVFEARDPELDRMVAVKVLRARSGDGSEGELRLRREGQTMARLTHPNVIRVYDVGVAHGHAFVAMEFVAGGTLADWLERAPRRTSEILAVFLEAGRGLAAAHDAGLVHRDFKPSNVLVGADGRVLVTDFGLARAAQDVAPPAAPGSAGDPAPGAIATVTRTGDLVGTPAYMAPEQFAGEPVDARADQFSFCVSLWRALFGIAPYEGTTFETLAASTGSGDLAPLPPGAASRVPAALRTAIARGLDHDPAARFPSMRELLAVLEPRPARRRLAVAVALGVVGVGGAATWVALGSRTSDPCPTPVARLTSVWGDARKASLRDRLAAIDPVTGPARYAAAVTVLDHAAPAWRDMNVAACRATRVDGRQSDTLLDARMRCLDDWLGQLGAAVTGLETAADPAQLEAAIKDVGSLPALDRCADLVALQAASQLPTEPAAHAEALAILEEAKAINVERKAGRRDGLDARADALLARARRLGNAAALAKALGIRWRVAASGADFGTALGYLRELTEVAARGHDDTEATNAWALMGRFTAMTQGKPEEAKVMLAAARAAAARAGDSPALTIEVLTDEADVFNAAGDGAGALANLERARSLLEGLHARDPGSPYAIALAGLLQTESNAHWYAGELDAAVPPLREAIALFDRVYGPDTVESAAGNLDLAQILRDQAKYDEARAAVEAAIRVRELRSGESPGLAMALVTGSEIARRQGRLPEAIAMSERAMRIARATMAPGDRQLWDVAIAMADQYYVGGRAQEALAIYNDALAQAERDGVTDINLAAWWMNLANMERAEGLCDKSLLHFRAGAEVGRKIEGETSRYIGGGLRGEAQCLVKLGKKAEAIAALERSQAYPVPPYLELDAALSRATLGRLLVETGRDRARGLAMAREAMARARELDDTGEADPRQPSLEAWLATQR